MGSAPPHSSSLLLSPYQPHPEGFVWLLFQPNPLLWYSHGKAWKCPEGQRDLDMLRSLFNGKAVPLKYPQQETAISHRHAKTAVTSLHQGDTWKESLPVVWALPCFILSLPLSGFSQCPPLWSPFKRPPSLCNSTHTAATYPLTLLTSGWLCDKQEHNRKPHNLTGSLRCKERFEIPFKLPVLPLNLAVREQLLCVTCLRVSARGGDRLFQTNRQIQKQIVPHLARRRAHLRSHTLGSLQVIEARVATCGWWVTTKPNDDRSNSDAVEWGWSDFIPITLPFLSAAAQWQQPL